MLLKCGFILGINLIKNSLKKITIETEKNLKIKKELQEELHFYDQQLSKFKLENQNQQKELDEKQLSQIEPDEKAEIVIGQLDEEIELLKEQEKKADMEEKTINQQLGKFHKVLSSVSNPELSYKLIKKQREVTKDTYFYQELLERKLLVTKEIQQTKSLINQSKRSHRVEMDDFKKISKIFQREIKLAKERKKYFGNIETQSKININQLSEKLESLKVKIHIIKRKIMDLEMGKDKFSSKMDTVLEFRDQINRSDWKHRLLTKNPEIKDLKERIDPLKRAISFAQNYGGSKVQFNKYLTKQVIDQLIMQHLEFENRKECRKKIEEITSTTYNSIQLRDSRLNSLFRISLREIENLWNIFMNNNSELNLTLEEKNKILETKIYEMGLEMFIDKNDLNIWQEPPDNPNNIIYKDDESNNNENNPHNIKINLNASGIIKNRNNTINNKINNNIQIDKQINMENGITEKRGEGERGRELIREMGMGREKEAESGKEMGKGKCKIKRLSKTLQYANINKIIEKLTIGETEVRYRDAFLMTYQSFMKPGYLFAKLKERYCVPHIKMNNWARFKDTIQIRVISALDSWIKLCWDDIDEKLCLRIVEFIQTTISTERQLTAQKLLKLIDDMKEKRQRGKSATFTGQIPEVIVPKNIFSRNFTLLDIGEVEFARQYTLYVFELFQKIKPSELVTEAWQKKSLKSKATNTLALINKFNEFSKFISTTIVEARTVKERARYYQKFLKIGKHLLELQNYDSLMSIHAGYMHSAVKRLKLTISEVPKNIIKLFLEIKSILKHDQGYKEYRQMLEKKEPPLVPYLGVFLTDITFISTGSPDKVNGLINFAKRKLLYNVVSKIQQYQRVPYNFFPIHQIQVLLKKEFKYKNDKDLFQISLKREPRN
ncbi:ras guanine nucleotide exchange factor i-related [Anaeramoeba flamelloides]|uniref:Ras guanine nucleotide exchange factor i-related n=1 Tax=Anaeramoeba flamelloides TaxID=1746091 RepID=A0ABQ8Y7V4_9EUKA|nr:ras guanine nucleotide exchange factor i-related [Anaeramoeba flamelloides]